MTLDLLSVSNLILDTNTAHILLMTFYEQQESVPRGLFTEG